MITCGHRRRCNVLAWGMILAFFLIAILTLPDRTASAQQRKLAYSENSTEALVYKNDSGTGGLTMIIHRWRIATRTAVSRCIDISRVLHALSANRRFHFKILYVFLSAKAP